ncbi:hypothetical protein QYE76_004260 [Lolium multiflorum]|uniref:Expansin-like EG45 domain-containing protein n=1 Tax=Lolium multiflorum TaxID=4521 RepID=A0AAD8RQT6_LOLMU|nr:hypothetical protein QYE76_004260 [Lolium multiflorum]
MAGVTSNGAVALVVVALLSLVVPSVHSAVDYGVSAARSYNSGWLPAKATWYGRPNGAGPDDNGGACGFKNVNHYPLSAMTSCGNEPLFQGGAGCGTWSAASSAAPPRGGDETRGRAGGASEKVLPPWRARAARGRGRRGRHATPARRAGRSPRRFGRARERSWGAVVGWCGGAAWSARGAGARRAGTARRRPAGGVARAGPELAVRARAGAETELLYAAATHAAARVHAPAGACRARPRRTSGRLCRGQPR